MTTATLEAPVASAPQATASPTTAPEGPWWGPLVPATVVEAFDACAMTGVGPDQDECTRAWRLVCDATWTAIEAPGADDELLEQAGDPECVLDLFVRERYGWGLPTGGAMDAIATAHAHEPVIEIGTGSGYVAACLRARGLEVTAINGAMGQWRGWWRRRFVDDALHVQADALVYDARAYVMIMPDGDGGDMMSEALFRMPVGSTLWLYAPEDHSGSPRGHALARDHFEEVASEPMLDRHPYEGDRRFLRRLVKVSQPAAMPAPIRRKTFGLPF